jgi:hypothetical protein
MTIEQVRAFIEGLGGVLTLAPGPGDGSPEISWGDLFFYYAPEGTLPPAQPFATVVTKDYPDEPASGLGRDGCYRVNIAAGAGEFTRWTGRPPRDAAGEAPEPPVPDEVVAHPVYGGLGWLAVVAPGPQTEQHVRSLLRTAHGLARQRHERRSAADPR